MENLLSLEKYEMGGGGWEGQIQGTWWWETGEIVPGCLQEDQIEMMPSMHA